MRHPIRIFVLLACALALSGADCVIAVRTIGTSQHFPFGVSSHTPFHHATGVAIGISIQVVFTSGIDHTTITARTVSLVHVASGTQVPCARVQGGADTELIVVPEARLLPYAAYELRLNGVGGVEREVLGEPYAIRFTTGTQAIQP